LTAAGFVATAVAFGPARMGFGLFLPAFREEFALSTSMAGLIASGGSWRSCWRCRRAPGSARDGQRMPVIAGALAATAGFRGGGGGRGARPPRCGDRACRGERRPVLGAVQRRGRARGADASRAGALSVVSTGTSFGVAAAAGLALAVTEGALDWRGAWVGFALGGLALAGIALAGLPPGRGPRPTPRRMVLSRAPALPSAPPFPSTARRSASA
jgi:hypothetical protein